MRHKVMSQLEIQDQVVVYDAQSIRWDTFDWTLGYQKHFVTANEILKGYLIADNYYGDVNYESIIFLLNNVSDPWEMVPGTEIRLPNLTDIQTFILNNRK